MVGLQRDQLAPTATIASVKFGPELSLRRTVTQGDLHMTTTLLSPYHLTLTSSEAEQVRSLGAKLTEDPIENADAYAMRAQALSAQLSDRIRDTTLRFRRYGDPTGGMLISGIAVDETPPTPADAKTAMGVRLTAARAMSIIAATLGDQYGFRPELSGQLVQDILPVHGFEDTQHSISSRAILELHCETSFTESRADFIGLLCLRADPEGLAGTLLCSARMILPMLSAETVAILRQPRFVTTVDGSFLRGSGAAGPIYIGPIVVVSGPTDRPRLRCDFAETRGLDHDAQQALNELYEVACAQAIEVRLRAGDLIFIDNHAAFHGRTAFKAHHDGTDRWLLRTFITRDLTRSALERPLDGRIIDTDYAAGPMVVRPESLPTEVRTGWKAQ
jgi:L-asparagine oxygenase